MKRAPLESAVNIIPGDNNRLKLTIDIDVADLPKKKQALFWRGIAFLLAGIMTKRELAKFMSDWQKKATAERAA